MRSLTGVYACLALGLALSEARLSFLQPAGLEADELVTTSGSLAPSTTVSNASSTALSSSVFANSTTTLSLSSTPSAQSTTSVTQSSLSANGTTSTPSPTTSQSAALPSATSEVTKRAAIPGCLKTVELSCLNLAANCIDSANSGNINSLWHIKSCVAAATCYGVGDLLSSASCQTGLQVTNPAQASLDYDNIYAPIVGSCAYQPNGCPITQQNFIDFYYGVLTQINTGNWPASTSVVIGFFNSVKTWTATGTTIPYTNFNDYLHFSSYPSTTITAGPSVPTYSQVTWNPNPYPPSTAASETFVRSGSTVVIAIPTVTTTITVVGVPITLAPGGTPINSQIPSDITMPGAITPSWTYNIIPPASATVVTFTAPGPPPWTSIVAAPTASTQPPVTVTGPPGNGGDDDDDNWWLLIFGLAGPLIGGVLPPGVGIPGGITPTPIPPPVWTGSWSDPAPTSTSTSSSSSSTTSDPACPLPTTPYSLPDDPENVDWEENGTDPDRRRSHELLPRAGRHIAVNRCGLSVENNVVNLGAGTYYSVGPQGGTGTNLGATNVGGRPGVGAATPQEHVFELGFIDDFFTDGSMGAVSCNWIEVNIFDYIRADGSDFGEALVQAIDQTANMVWVDRPLNQAKSNVVNNNRASAATPPQKENMDKITDWGAGTAAHTVIQDVEFFARNFAALGQYFGATSNIFQATANRVQNLLSEVTPNTPLTPSLPSQFNRWLRTIISQYPNGCTSRANNVYNYYHNKMNAVSIAKGNAQGPAPVPQCYPLYNAAFNPSGFTWQNLIPPTPTLPGCDTAGTQGRFSVGPDANGNPIFISTGGNGNYWIIASGRIDNPAFGNGNSLSQPRYWAVDLSTSFGNCNNVYHITHGTPAQGAAGVVDTQIALNCGGGTGKVNAGFDFVVNNQINACVIYNHNDGSGSFNIICGTNAGSATTCGNSIVQAGLGQYPNAALTTPHFAFYPN